VSGAPECGSKVLQGKVNCRRSLESVVLKVAGSKMNKSELIRWFDEQLGD